MIFFVSKTRPSMSVKQICCREGCGMLIMSGSHYVEFDDIVFCSMHCLKDAAQKQFESEAKEQLEDDATNKDQDMKDNEEEQDDTTPPQITQQGLRHTVENHKKDKKTKKDKKEKKDKKDKKSTHSTNSKKTTSTSNHHYNDNVTNGSQWSAGSESQDDSPQLSNKRPKKTSVSDVDNRDFSILV